MFFQKELADGNCSFSAGGLPDAVILKGSAPGEDAGMPPHLSSPKTLPLTAISE